MANDIMPIVLAIPGFCQPVSSLSHLAAAGVALVAGIALIRRARGSRTRVLALGIYTFCMVGALAISGIYHSLERGGAARAIMRQVDYYGIWLLIAGTFTAVHGIMCRGFWRHGVLTFIWCYALVGVILQILWFDIFSGVAGLVLYLVMGWAGLASAIQMGRQIGFRAVRPVWFAGFAFTSGAVLEAIGLPVLSRDWVGPHEIFHLAVIAGIFIHFLFVRTLVLKHAPGMCPPVVAPGTQV